MRAAVYSILLPSHGWQTARIVISSNAVVGSVLPPC